MGNFFSDVFNKTSMDNDAGMFSDPLGKLFAERDRADEEEENRKKQEAENQRLKDKLQGKIRDVLNLHGSAMPTDGDKRQAGRRELARQRSRAGRESTILTGDLLGG